MQTRRSARRWLVVGGGVGSLVLLAGCAFLAVLALILGGLGVSRLGLLARATDTPQPTATESPTLTPTASLTPTVTITNTATATPEPATTTPTASRVVGTGAEFVSPLATPTLWPTATRSPLPTATRRPAATATRWPAATVTRAPTLTPRPTVTRAPTSTPLITCHYGDTMTFDPASPLPGVRFTIEVRSLTGYTDVSLTGGDSPDFKSVTRSGLYYVWQWEDSLATAGTYSYSFKIRSGALTCVTKSVTVNEPTSTPTPTPMVFDLGLVLIGSDLRTISPGGLPVTFDLSLTNLGNGEDTFELWLTTSPDPPPQGLTAQLCVGDCSVPASRVTLAAGATQALSIKFTAAADAPLGVQFSATLWAQSLGDPTKKKSQQVTVAVTQPSSAR